MPIHIPSSSTNNRNPFQFVSQVQKIEIVCYLITNSWCSHIYVILTTAIVKLMLCLIVCAPVWVLLRHCLTASDRTAQSCVSVGCALCSALAVLLCCVPWYASLEQRVQFRIYVKILKLNRRPKLVLVFVYGVPTICSAYENPSKASYFSSPIV